MSGTINFITHPDVAMKHDHQWRCGYCQAIAELAQRKHELDLASEAIVMREKENAKLRAEIERREKLWKLACEENAAIETERMALRDALKRLVDHDKAQDLREGVPNCAELEAAWDLLLGGK